MLRGFFRRRKTVLFAWELGGGRGHVERLITIARAISRDDLKYVFALRHAAGAGIVHRAFPDAAVIEAPVAYRGEGANACSLASNYADILFRCGYDEPENLVPAVRAWDRIMNLYSPNLVIADHSPTVVLTVRSRRPVVSVGTGFTTPPVGMPFMTLFPPSASGAASRERAVLRSMNHAEIAIGGSASAQVFELWRGTDVVPCAWPELDPYRVIRRPEALGPLELPCDTARPPKNRSIFGYLAGEDPRIESWVLALVKSRINAGIYVRNAPENLAALAAGSNVRVFTTPQPVPDALIDASVFIHHGGSTANLALAAGRPQVIIPRNLDQYVLGQALQRLGCGVTCGDATELVAALHAAFGSKSCETAMAVARQVAARPSGRALAAIIEKMDVHLSR